MTIDPKRPEPAEREELARLLPLPPERELSGRHQRALRDELLREFRQDSAGGARPRLKVRHLKVAALPLAAGALALTLATSGVFGQEGGTTVSGTGTTATPGGKAPATTAAAVVLLDRIATVAASRPAFTVRDDQYVYVASKVAWSVQTDDDPLMRLDTPHSRKVWFSVDGSRAGLLHEKGKRIPLGGDLDKDGNPVPGDEPGNPSPNLNNPTYRYLETLPTDPETLLEKIYDETAGSGPGPDQEAFVTIGDLLREQIAPPEVSAALYKAAALVPGVTVVDDSVDAAGRHGVAVARVHAGQRTEWIFDRRTLEFLGERGVMLEDSPEGRRGQITATTAILKRGITDRPGELPARTG
ncbi:CU044_5270 family protein [Streptomyces filamentosus]|uniref:CU044_5270 family protein n=1 Tax=Streptomyces filamentosus TaxID=67294 RepID=UPI00331D25CE